MFIWDNFLQYRLNYSEFCFSAVHFATANVVLVVCFDTSSIKCATQFIRYPFDVVNKLTVSVARAAIPTGNVNISL